MTHYCTYFDKNFLIRGLALYRSMVRHCQPFHLHVLCLDDDTHSYLTAAQLDGVTAIRLADLEAADPALLIAKQNRSRVEYYFTLTPSLTLHVLTQAGSDDVTYIDADFYFFSNPQPFRDALVAHSVVIVGHRFPPRIKHLERWGIFNVGILGFRNDAAGLACLGWWRDRCLEWCYDRLEDGKFADQKYLDDWPDRFLGVGVLGHKGVNFAPWNVAGSRLERRNGSLTVDGDLLVCYHFHRFRIVNSYLYHLNLREYHAKLSPLLRRHVYGPYVRELQGLVGEVSLGTSIRHRDGLADRVVSLFTSGTVIVASRWGLLSV